MSREQPVLNKGGQLQAKVVAVSDDEFTVRVDGRGHEHHEKEIDLPVAWWNGAGAVCGPRDKLGYPVPKKGPEYGASVIFSADLYDAEEEESKPSDSEVAAGHADRAASAADRAEAAAAKAVAAAAQKPAGS